MSSPGWFPQPDGTERYFDGSQWTAQTRPAGNVPPPTRKTNTWKWIAIIVSVVVVGCLGMCLIGALGAGNSDSTDGDQKTQSSSSTKKSSTDKADGGKKARSSSSSKESRPDHTTTAAGIIEEFEDNELAGDQKYKGKVVQVSGIVDKIDTELFNDDKYRLNITDGGDFSFLSVTCSDMSNDVLSKLTVGDDITVIGSFDDGGDLGVELKDCRVV